MKPQIEIKQKRYWAKNLLTLASYMDKVPEEKYDQSDWGFRNPCGTIACALGHAAISGLFREEGLQYEWERLYMQKGWHLKILFAPTEYRNDFWFWRYIEAEHLDDPKEAATEHIFGPEVFYELFASYNAVDSPKQMACILREFVLGKYKDVLPKRTCERTQRSIDRYAEK